MSLLDSLKKFTQPYADEEFDDYEDDLQGFEEEPQEEPAPARTSRRTSPFSTAASRSSESTYSAPAPTPAPTTGFNGQVLNMHSGKQEVVLFHAKTFDDAAKASDELRKRKAIILNMENVDKALTRRVVDFLSGSVYALEGSVKKVAQSTYLFCPHNMDVTGDLESSQAEVESYI